MGEILPTRKMIHLEYTRQEINSPYEEHGPPRKDAPLEQLSRRFSDLPSAPRAARTCRHRSSSKRRMSQLNMEELRCSRCSDSSLFGNSHSRSSRACRHKLAGT